MPSSSAVWPPGPVEGDVRRAASVEQLHDLMRPENDHLPRTRLVCLENTHNRGGGRVLPYDGVVAICDWAHEHRPGDPSRWGTPVQCRCRVGNSSRRVGAAFRHRQRLFQQGSWRAGWLGPGRPRRFDRRSAAASQGAGGRHAAGGRDRGRSAVCAGAPHRSPGRRSSACQTPGRCDSRDRRSGARARTGRHEHRDLRGRSTAGNTGRVLRIASPNAGC